MDLKNTIKKYYNQEYKGVTKEKRNLDRIFGIYKIYLNYLKAKKKKMLLDVGTGDGNLLKAGEERGLKVFGIDISKNAIKISKSLINKSIVAVGSGEELPFTDKSFDYITCLGSLEHFLSINKGLKEMLRVAKGNAKFCIVVPNINFWGWKLKGKLGTEQIQEKLLNLKEWERILERNNFFIIKILKDRHPPKLFNILSIIERIIYEILWHFVPLNLCPQFIFICKKYN